MADLGDKKVSDVIMKKRLERDILQHQMRIANCELRIMEIDSEKEQLADEIKKRNKEIEDIKLKLGN